VAIGNVSGIGGEHKFYFKEILERWFKVDVQEAISYNTTVKYPNEDASYKIMEDIVGTAIIWNQKHMKIVS
jgi:hypothetical protein